VSAQRRLSFGIDRVPALNSAQANDTTLITATVLDVQPVPKGRLLALASVELVLDGVPLVLYGVQVIRLKHPLTGKEATGVELPRYRAPDGSWRQAVELPPELRRPLGDAVLEQCCLIGDCPWG
jgi:stage V sporulation protein G